MQLYKENKPKRPQVRPNGRWTKLAENGVLWQDF